MADQESPWGFPSPDFAPLKQSWDQVLADPRGQAAVLSFAAQALQPRQFGQSNAGLLGESLAKGGEAIRGIDKQEQQTQELESKQGLREAQSNAAAARADTATMRTDYAGARLALQQSEADRKTESNRMGGILRAQAAYQAHVHQIAEDNKALQKAALLDPSAMQRIRPIPQFQEWIAANPQFHELYGKTPGVLGQGSGATTPPSPTPQAPTSTPDAPSSPADRVKGTRYKTPQGDLVWTGTGWIK